jgi:ATPase subunit of ABC transporter with duplicated ATPase domains
MIHKPIQIKNLELSFPHKICIESFNHQIAYGSRIAVIGKNGSGKSTLLKVIANLASPSGGTITHRDDVVVGYVPQVIDGYKNLSGGQRLNSTITKALNQNPNLLLLDEPTNHLDQRNRRSLIRMLQSYRGTLIIVSHDTELLRHCVDTLWHIDSGKVYVFSGNYDDYVREIKLKRKSIESDIAALNRQKKDIHNQMMQEQQRAAKSRAKGEKSIKQRKWPTIVSTAKAGRAEETSGGKKNAIQSRNADLTKELESLRLPEIIVPKFSIESSKISNLIFVQISDGAVGYSQDKPMLSGINLSLFDKERIAIVGDNGCGKSTLIKGILDDEYVYKLGDWYVASQQNIGYLDQHYTNLNPNKSALEIISELVPHFSHSEIRCHLNDFLFRKNEEVNLPVMQLSGGEKARLSLAQIAMKTPRLLILDEITNNLDLETKEHVVQVLRNYPGAMIIISHDADFLKEIGVEGYYQIADGYLNFSTK